MTFSWNLVTKNVEKDDSLEKKLRQKISKLERHLKHFPPDAVHLQIVIERGSGTPQHNVKLTLRVPSAVLHTAQSGEALITTFDEAVKSLLRELEKFKSTARGERLWKRKARREELRRQLKTAGFAQQPQPEGNGPQNREDVIRELLQYHYQELLRHARRHIRNDELAGDIPAGALDARAIVDEVARRAIATHATRPNDMGWLVWFYHLIHEELKRRRQLVKEKEVTEVPTEKPVQLPELSEQNLQPLEEFVEKKMEPQVIRIEDIVPNSEALPPDEILAEKEALEQLQQDIKHWPRAEREVFELYYVEGLAPEEIAHATGQPLAQVKETISVLRQRLRRALLEDSTAMGARV